MDLDGDGITDVLSGSWPGELFFFRGRGKVDGVPQFEPPIKLKDKNNKTIMTVYRGDIIGGRFRVTSISQKELVLTDTSLKIKHTIAMSESDKNAGPLSRPTPRVDSEDDEP